MDFAVPADHRIKLKEGERRDKYLDVARELKKLWNMKMTMIPIVIGTFRMILQGLVKGLEDLEISGQAETIHTTVLLRTVGILRRVLETWGDLLSLRLQSHCSLLPINFGFPISIYLSIYHFVYIYQPINFFSYLSIYLSIYLSHSSYQCLSHQYHINIYLSIYLSICFTANSSPLFCVLSFFLSFSSEAVVMRQVRRWKWLWRRALTRSHKRTSMGPSRSFWNGTTSGLQPEEITSKGARLSCVYYQ